MEEILDSNLAKELLTILPYLDDVFVDNLSDAFLENITSLAADSNKNFYIDKNKKLYEQDLSDECKNLLSLLYCRYTDEEEQEELINIWKSNEVD